MAVAFGVPPIHLGVIFLSNLELGYLTPPVGLNLYLAASRFNKPLPSLYKHVVPFLLILGIGVLLITYIPSMSLGILKLFGKILADAGVSVLSGGAVTVNGIGIAAASSSGCRRSPA